MRKTVFFIALILLALNIPAQTEGKKMSLSICPELNMNARENFAGGAGIGFNYNFFDIFAEGVSFTASGGFNGGIVLEPAVMFRWYLSPSRGGYTGFFAQADIGAYLVFEDGDVTALFNGGLRGGYHLPLGGRFFVEPYGRIGYPFAFGLGAAAGVRF